MITTGHIFVSFRPSELLPVGNREKNAVNRLGAATSPYLLQHADNPVDWWEWEPEAFEEARRRNVPVLLSVGYAAATGAT